VREEKIGSSVYFRFVAIFCLLVVGFISLGFFCYHQEAQSIQEDKYEDLSTIAKLKAVSIQEWQKNKLADVRLGSANSLVRREIAGLLKDPMNLSAKAELQGELKINRKEKDYAEAFFLDTKGNILLSDDPNPATIDQATIKAIGVALKNHKAVLSDFFRTSEGSIYIDALAPILNNSGQSIAILVLRSNAADFLYPFIQAWPTPSRTAETLLVCRDGNSVLFLNELRHRSNTALTLRFPLTDTHLPGVQAALGHYGRVRGKDYREEDVLAVTQPVLESPWSVVAKEDAKEILAEVRYRGRVVVLIVFFLILVSAGLIIAVYRKRQELNRQRAENALRQRSLDLEQLNETLEQRVLERTAELEKANQRLKEQSRILESFFKDTITPLVLLDRDFNFIRVNEAYARACQRAITDFPGHNHFEFFPHEENEAIFRQVVETGIPFQALAKPFSFPNHPEWGVTYWDWILTPLVDDQGKTAFLVFSLEEVTDRQMAEEALHKSERELRTLANQLLYAQENERKRVARDMHDSLGASLSALKYKMEDLIHNFPDQAPQQIRETLGSLIPIIQNTIGEARRMQNDLRPPLLDDLGILPTLAWFSREFQKIYSQIAIEQRLEVREEEVPDLLKVVIYRITQEALNNIGKHARATQARIYLGREQDRLKLVIWDNGAGFEYQRRSESADQPQGMGLSSMKERAELSGGSFSLETRAGQGTSVEVSWPLMEKREMGNQAD
jgi:PAS domain S-box-containing protein